MKTTDNPSARGCRSHYGFTGHGISTIMPAMNVQLLRGACAAIGFLTVTGFCFSKRVEAAHRRLPPASVCAPVSGYESRVGYNYWSILQNITANQSAAITCGIPSDTTITHTSTTALSIHGENSRPSSPYPWIAACVHDWDLLANSCGTSYVIGPGIFNATPSRSAWNSATKTDWYPYLDLQTYGSEEIYGIYVAN
jgi:hypothetical protein